MAAEGQSDKVVFDMEVWMKQRSLTEFHHAEKIAPIDIHWCLLNIYGEQTVDVSTVRWWATSAGASFYKFSMHSLLLFFLLKHKKKESNKT